MSFNSNTFHFIWNWLHQIPWICFNREFLSEFEVSVVLEYFHLLMVLIPCTICAASAPLFEKYLQLLPSISFPYNGKIIVSRFLIARYWYRFHNIVNAKLFKKQIQSSWKDTLLIKRPYWEHCYWMVLFLIIWNYEPEKSQLYKKFINYSFLIIRNTTLGIKIQFLLKKDNKGHFVIDSNYLSSRESLQIFIHRLYSLTNENTWSYEDLNAFMEVLRVKNTTSCKRK